MKITIIFVLLALFSITNAELAVLNENFIASINSQQNQWTATSNNRFSGMTTQELKQFLGELNNEEVNNDIPIVSYDHILEYTTLPEQFDSREQWGDFIHPIRDQGKCGSCWAFASSEGLSDRFAIASNGKINVVLSPQYQVSCDSDNDGCDGGSYAQVWRFFQRYGTTTEECMPYTSGTGQVEQCINACVDGSDIKHYRTKNVNFLYSVEDAKLEILTNGPIYTGFSVYEDFMAYSSGIYKFTQGRFLGGHAVKIIGWGIKNGINYWIVANSWGTKWGEQGFFKIQQGECSFENKFITGDPIV